MPTKFSTAVLIIKYTVNRSSAAQQQQARPAGRSHVRAPRRAWLRRRAGATPLVDLAVLCAGPPRGEPIAGSHTSSIVSLWR
eukprot:SAG31_NODE_32128_length_359_cov_1.788462_1_plen_81_part_10